MIYMIFNYVPATIAVTQRDVYCATIYRALLVRVTDILFIEDPKEYLWKAKRHCVLALFALPRIAVAAQLHIQVTASFFDRRFNIMRTENK